MFELVCNVIWFTSQPDKTNIYMGGVKEDVKQSILRDTNFVEGEFPFRYLGVPLNEGKLNKSMFADLLSKVQKCLHSWAKQRISYAGKISLINSVIFGLEQFWCSTLLIPKGVIKLITKFCRHFLWGSEEGKRKLIMKSWGSCCTPHSEGGFNIKEILSWNKCILCKWIWIVDTHSDSLWANWNHTYNIKFGDFWTMSVKPCHSESWRSLLKVRNDLVAKIGSIAEARDFLSTCISGGKMQLHKVYDLLREPNSKVSWVRAVWNKAVVPKHSFIAVLAMCVLCKAASEDHQHLFFQCHYSSHIWKHLLDWMGLRGRSMRFKSELHWIAHRRHRRHWKFLWVTTCLNALVYSIWEERNSRIFNNVEHAVEHAVEHVIRRVQFLVSVKLLHVTPSSHEEEVLYGLNSC
ncbi:uncharacterized protein LOC141601441 [Silene latifolia]|uniref:uncharacterized protein LOC141601441 n=1 Tax=Silene latifolia TaxID=37657 RepID=UPI003D774DCC